MFTIPQASSFQIKHYWFAGFALVLAVLHEALQWKIAAGFGFVIFVLCFLFGFLMLVSTTKHIHEPRAHILLIPILLITGSAAFYNNNFVLYFAPLIVKILLVIYTLLVTLRPSAYSFGFLNIPAFRGIGPWFRNGAALIKTVMVFKRKSANTALFVLTGVAIAVPIIAIFIALFRSADPVFDLWYTAGIDFIFRSAWIAESLGRILRILLMVAFFGTLFHVCLDESHTSVDRTVEPEKYNDVIVGIILGLVNVIFGIFAFIQIKYFFITPSAILETGGTFAEAAREGFFQLTFVLVLASFLLAIIFRSYARHTHSKIIKALELLLIVLVGVVALSALKRMNLYQIEYGYTVMRLYVEWFIYGTLALLLLGFFSIVRNTSFKFLSHGVLVVAVGSVSVISLINVDRMIAKENVDRYLFQNKSIDFNYLGELSVDAYPEIIRLAGTEKMNTNVDTVCADQENPVDEIVKKRDEAVKRANSWRSLNVGILNALIQKDDLSHAFSECQKKKWYTSQLLDLRASHAFKCGFQAGDCEKYFSKDREPVSYEITIIHYDVPNIRTMTLISKSSADNHLWFATVLRSDSGGEFLPISEESFRTDEPESEVYLKNDTIYVFNDKKREYRTYLVKPQRIYGFWQMTKKQQPVLTDTQLHTYVAPVK